MASVDKPGGCDPHLCISVRANHAHRSDLPMAHICNSG